MTQLIDIDTLMRSSPSGTMAYSRFVADTATGWQTGLFIREDRQHIAALGKSPTVAVRSGMFTEDGVALVAVLVQVGGEVYETWLNYHQTGGGQQYFQDLAKQDRLPIIFYGSRRRERSIIIRNPLKDLMASALEVLADAKPWSMSQFDQARERIYAQHPSVHALWRALGAQP